MRRRIPARVRASVWPILAAVAAIVPVRGAFSTTNVFYVRDLAVFFWPRHLWLRQTVRAGDSALWDPYAGGGQSAVADALNQFFLLPVTIVRVLLPDIWGFNFWIAAPFPLMAVGAWFWLHRRASPAAACVGAALYAAAGPIVSTGTFPNLSWAIAFIPWALWATDRVLDRPSVRRVTVLATCVGLQAVAGEPVTLAATGALIVAYAAAGAPATAWRERATRVRLAAVALAGGALLSMVQMLPLMWAARHSLRAGGINAQLWSMHPLEIVETFIAHLLGHADDGLPATMPWHMGMHGREPLFSTLYVGIGALALAAMCTRDARLRHGRVFWWTVAGVALVAALGAYTPVYPALQAAVPLLQSFRYPVKYVIFVVVAVAALAAHGADALLAHARSTQPMRRPALSLAAMGVGASASAILAIATVAQPEWVRMFWESTATAAHFQDPVGAAEWMIGRSSPLFFGIAALGTCMSLLLFIVWRGHARAALAAAAFCAVAVADPLAVNQDLHPTMNASLLGPPEWVSLVESHEGERVYVGGRVLRLLGPQAERPVRLDAPERFSADAELPVQQGNALLGAHLVHHPAAWGLRESISTDLPELWPREYSLMIDKFRVVPRDSRFLFLRRTGVRYCYVADSPFPGAQPLTRPVALTGSMALYDCGSPVPRAYVTRDARVEPDLRTHIDLMFDPAHDPGAQVLLELEPPPPAGRPETPAAAPEAHVVSERNTELVVRVSVGAQGGYLNVIDSYDPGWRVEVDGEPAILLRGNALYRAVRLAPGQHEVRFRYRPIPFFAGLMVTMATLLALLIGCGREWLTARGPARRMRQAVTA